jgi:anion-transporting  ArsA/GET3 family ATPase
MTLLDRLAGLELIVVTGKGGVGKSTLAAALGRVLARRGRRTLLLEIDPRESLFRLLGVPPSGGEFQRVDDRLFVQNLSPRAVLDEVVREQLRLDLLSRRLLASPIYKHFAEAAPGLKEVAALGHALRVVRGDAGGTAPEVDLVVLDAPATGHGVSLLAAPQLVADVIHDGPFARMGAELATFISNAESCGIVLAAAAEEMPVQEAIELIESLAERLSRRPELLVVNGLYPGPASDTVDHSTDATLELWQRRRRVNDRELRRLDECWRGPRVELPLLPLESGVELVDTIGDALEGELETRRPWS